MIKQRYLLQFIPNYIPGALLLYVLVPLKVLHTLLIKTQQVHQMQLYYR